ncbi:Lactotransferrin [Gossypium arboreum]|uniref:Lactotransferrin n=1 Tax=Gossypium arboreum TaxID=29729 RepID=A0A0B0M9C2_GOSAR|nr:Lactotransferrin [Gossypium arboreum]
MKLPQSGCLGHPCKHACASATNRNEIALCMTVFEAKISPITPRTTSPEIYHNAQQKNRHCFLVPILKTQGSVEKCDCCPLLNYDIGDKKHSLPLFVPEIN